MYNKVTLVGYLGKDVDLKETTNGHSVAKFRLATNFYIKDKDITEWHNIVVWGKQAEPCKKFLKKGSLACVEGRISYRTFDNSGTKVYMTEILAERVIFLNGNTKKKSEDTQETVYDNTDDQVNELPF